MKKTVKIRLSFALLCCMAALWPQQTPAQTQAIEKKDNKYIKHVEKRVEAVPGQTLRFKTSQGPIRVITSDRAEVFVQAEERAEVFTETEARAIFDDYQITAQKEASGVVISAQSQTGRDARSLQVEFTLTVPSAYNVVLETRGGSIKVADLTGSVNARTSGGSIDIGQITNGSVDLKTAGGSIGVAGVKDGDVQARTAGGGITVGDVTGTVTVGTAGGSLKIGHTGGMVSAKTSGGSIAIEQSEKGIEAETAGGSIKINGAGDRVNAHTSGGSITVRNAKGSVDLDTAGGSITVENSQSDIEVETAGGSIYITGSGGPVSATTRGGSIAIKAARGAIEAKTSGGSIVAELIVSDPKIDTHCNLESSGGEITLSIPQNLAATVEAELRLEGDGRYRDYQIYSDFALDIAKDGDQKYTAQGKINGGGSLIRILTVNGNIHIKKLANP